MERGGSNGFWGVSGDETMSFEDYSVALNLDAEYHNQQLHMGTAT